MASRVRALSEEENQPFLRADFFFFATLPAFFAAGFFALFVFVFFAAM